MADQPLDVALLVPAWSDEADWTGRAHLYVHQRPAATAVGARAWLCRDRRLFHSYRIEGFVELADVDETGWALAVADGRPESVAVDDVPDPGGVARHWRQGFRYLAPGGAAFVRAPRRTAAQETATPPPSADPPGGTDGQWVGRVARALRRRPR